MENVFSRQCDLGEIVLRVYCACYRTSKPISMRAIPPSAYTCSYSLIRRLMKRIAFQGTSWSVTNVLGFSLFQAK